ncbi:MAG: hypothetical protein A2X69_09210 [Rhodobacteraceae bacterium GWF1_65_7]|nr:MAG: hypothetical protein A2X69_09210 [Rhodobacteraceae bacterium GWF1_65_7]
MFMDAVTTQVIPEALWPEAEASMSKWTGYVRVGLDKEKRMITLTRPSWYKHPVVLGVAGGLLVGFLAGRR